MAGRERLRASSSPTLTLTVSSQEVENRARKFISKDKYLSSCRQVDYRGAIMTNATYYVPFVHCYILLLSVSLNTKA